MNRYLLALTAAAITISIVTSANPASAQDQSADASAADSGEIIVTARRVEERLQDVPISITVFNQQQLADRNIVSPVDLATYTPSLTTNQRFGPEKTSFVIRGFTQESNTSPSVGVYFADVVAPRALGGTTTGNGAAAGSFFDLQNVQVLKGPQGTLFGRNTTGGSILLVPQKPKDALEGFVEGSVGNYDLKRVQAVINIPVTDTLRVRAGVDRNSRSGYMRNHSGIGPDAYNDVNYIAARFSVVGELTPNLENYTIASFTHSFGNGYAARMVKCDPTAVGGTSTYGDSNQFFVTQTANRANTAYAACDQIARQNARGDSLLDVEVNNPDPKIDIRQWQLINTTTWQPSDHLTIKNIVSYAEFRENAVFNLNSDNFYVPVGLGFANAGARFQYQVLSPAASEENANQSTFTEELQFQGRSGNQKLSWQAGLYLEVSKPLGFSAGLVPVSLLCTNPQALQCTAPLGSGLIVGSATKSSFNNKGIYAQGTYDLTSELSVTAGIRYTIDRMRQISEGTRFSWVAATQSLKQFCLNPNLQPVPATAAGVTRSQCQQTFTADSERPTWLIDLEYKPDADVMLYAKYSRGYRQGGINANNPGFETWGPERVDAYELGAKTSFRGAVSGYFNIAAFWNELGNQQVSAALRPKPGFSTATAILNAGKSRIRGIEADASMLLFNSLRVEVGYAYLDTKVIDFVQPTLNPAGAFESAVPSVAIGSPLVFSPKNRLTFTGTYTIPLNKNLGEASVGVTYTHADSQRATTPIASPYYLLPATDLVNLNFNWQEMFGRPIDLGLFVTNLTNKKYAVGIGSSYATGGFEQLLIGQPRMFGARLRYSFGR